MAVAVVHVQSWKKSFAGIVPQSFLDKMSVEKRAQAFEERFTGDFYKMYVAETEGRGIVGFADFGEPRRSVAAYEAELYAIYLLPDFQGNGIGGRLFREGTKFLTTRGKNSMYLLALEDSPYRSFYEKMGGRVTGREQISLDGEIFDALIYGWESLG